MGLPLQCQLWSDVPAALMIYRNSNVCVCARAFIVRATVMSVSQMPLELCYKPQKPSFCFGCLAVATQGTPVVLVKADA